MKRFWCIVVWRSSVCKHVKAVPGKPWILRDACTQSIKAKAETGINDPNMTTAKQI